jgi:iron(III) transport system substrate-binding protein
MTRRSFLATTSAAAAGLALGACRKPAAAKASLVVYCSADPEIGVPVLESFERASGVRVEPVFDTEATKTTGLVNRLLAERAAPRADAWWSSEPFGTVRLARAGVLQRFRASRAEAAMAASPWGRWPEDRRDISRNDDGSVDAPLWYGFGDRLRVMVYNTTIVRTDDLPLGAGRLGLLAHERFMGRVAIARPQFGTTRGHMAILRHAYGEADVETWLRALKRNGVQVLDGNATVVRAVATGAAHIGLTDSDDVFSGQRQGWPVAMMLEPFPAHPVGTPFTLPPSPDLDPRGPASLPNTAGVIAGSRSPDAAGELIEHLLSPEVQRLMAASDSRNIPVDPALRAELASWAPVPEPGVLRPGPRLEEVETHVEPAMALVERVLGS